MTAMPSPLRRREIIDALRRGTVPKQGLDAFAVGLDWVAPTIQSELQTLIEGSSQFKAVRGGYGSGKTFFTRWIAEEAKRRGFAATEVQISETETPLHRLETVYRRLIEHLSTASEPGGALGSILNQWTYALEEDVLRAGKAAEGDAIGLSAEVGELMEARLAAISRTAPDFARAVRGYQGAVSRGDHHVAEGILAWLGASPNVPQSIKKAAAVKGNIDHQTALTFLQGLLAILRDAGHPGLLVVLDEVETLQRMRSDVRERSLNALRQLIDEVDSGRFPGLYLVITGTPEFFTGPQGVRRLGALEQRLHTDFADDARWDNPRDVQIRLPAFDEERLIAVGLRIRDIYVADKPNAESIRARVDDAYIRDFALAVAGELGGKVGIAPRIFLRKIVDVLDRVDQFADFDPRTNYTLRIDANQLSLEEREAVAPRNADDIDLDL